MGFSPDFIQLRVARIGLTTQLIQIPSGFAKHLNPDDPSCRRFFSAFFKLQAFQQASKQASKIGKSEGRKKTGEYLHGFVWKHPKYIKNMVFL